MIDDNSKEFIARHIGPSQEDQEKMLHAVGAKSLDDLMDNTVPEKILLSEELKVSEPVSENDALKILKSIIYSIPRFFYLNISYLPIQIGSNFFI